MANGKAPTVHPSSEKPLLNVEGLNDARTPLADFFSILIEIHRPAHTCIRLIEGDPYNLYRLSQATVSRHLTLSNEKQAFLESHLSVLVQWHTDC